MTKCDGYVGITAEEDSKIHFWKILSFNDYRIKWERVYDRVITERSDFVPSRTTRPWISSLGEFVLDIVVASTAEIQRAQIGNE